MIGSNGAAVKAPFGVYHAPDEFRVGGFVVHPQYGRGQLVNVEGEGLLRKGRVTFDRPVEGKSSRVFVLAKAPLRPLPTVATLADLKEVVARTRWLWEGWLQSGHLNVLAALAGDGKTRFVADLARRLWLNLPWPDGAENRQPAGSRTLWVAADRNFPELIAIAEAFGLPDHAMLFNATVDDPCDGLSLDGREDVEALGERIREARPALVVIDTLGMTTDRNLCRPEEARAFFGPLLDLALTTETTILGLTHLSLGGDPLGRRVVEKARTVIKLSCPDPEGQPNRRKLWVDKSNSIKPKPLGISMGMNGNEYDDHPPTEPASDSRPGPKADKTPKAVAWLRDRLSEGPARIGETIAAAEAQGIAKSTLYRAAESLGVETTDGPPKRWALPESDPADDATL